MVAMLGSLLMAVATVPGAALVYMHELSPKTGAIALALEGEHYVHAWVAPDGDHTLRIGDAAVRLPAAPAGDTPLVWVSADTPVRLTQGDVRIEAGAGIHALVFTASSRWRAERVMPHVRVFPTTPAHVEDARAQSTRHTDTRFTMTPYEDLTAWEAMADTLRTRMRVACGLYPWPTKTPMNARVFDRYDGDGFTVEKVHIEAFPGFLVTGNLYRPAGQEGPFPGVVCPHGHWGDGRLANEERGSVPARCITLARMGCVVFSYDMIGYVDSMQFPHNWGDQALELYGLHPFAFQLWSSIRAVDFIAALPDVDATRIACTGASGGGTQTFALTAVDERIRVCAPVNMISANMQGGCICENAPLIRIDNSNMEIGALAAPRPMLMVSATGDWTHETPRVEYPAIREIYALYGVPEHVENVHIDAPHNYNLASREAMYRFFGTWLLDMPAEYADFTEPALEIPPVEALRVFSDDALPEGMKSREEVLDWAKDMVRRKWTQTAAHDNLYRQAYGWSVPEADALDCERVGFEAKRDYVLESWVLGRRGVGDRIPALLYRATEGNAQEVVLIVDGAGKASTADMEDGGPSAEVNALLEAGKAVLAIDPFLIGEHHAPRNRTERLVPGQYIHTFQPSDTMCRVQDVLTAVGWLQARRDIEGTPRVIGRGDGAVWATFAAAAGGLRDVQAELEGVDLTDDATWVKRFFIPGILGLGGLETAQELIAAAD